jgi:hypothetical protein
MSSEGKLVRVRKGLYWKGVPSRFGAGRPNPLDVALKLTPKGVGPTGWTASHALGLSTQVPAGSELAITGRRPAPPAGVSFHSRSNLDRLNLRYHEIALLEVLREWPHRTEADWPTLLDSVRKLERNGLVNSKRILRNFDREPLRVRELMTKLAA